MRYPVSGPHRFPAATREQAALATPSPEPPSTASYCSPSTFAVPQPGPGHSSGFVFPFPSQHLDEQQRGRASVEPCLRSPGARHCWQPGSSPKPPPALVLLARDPHSDPQRQLQTVLAHCDHRDLIPGCPHLHRGELPSPFGECPPRGNLAARVGRGLRKPARGALRGSGGGNKEN